MINTMALKWTAAFDATSGFDELKIYNNYGHGTEGLNALYGKRKLRRLLDLKKEWDPKGLFVYNNPLPITNEIGEYS
jgi:hypothetical protein